jgi:hypothetical protein
VKKLRTPSWRTKLLIMMLLFAVGPVVILAWLGFNILSETYEASAVRGLQALARRRQGSISSRRSAAVTSSEWRRFSLRT